MAFVITPDSAVFENGISDTITFSITTDNEDYTFVKENTTTEGSGRVTFDKTTKTMTATAYGKARYKFIDGTDVYPFNIEVKRPAADSIQDLTQYIELGNNAVIYFTPPSGYYLKRYEVDDLDSNVVTVDSTGYELKIVGNKLGSVKLNIVLGKTTTDTSGVDTDVDTEYNGGTVTVNVINFIMTPSDTTVSLILNAEHNISKLYIDMDYEGTRGDLTFVSNYGLSQQCFDLNVTTSTELDKTYYSLLITGKSDGVGTIEVKHNGNTVKVIDVLVEDRKGLTIEPKLDTITLGYLESYTFENITYVDNGQYTEAAVETSANPPFTYELVESPAGSKNYKLTVTNNSSAGGTGILTVKGKNSYEGQQTITVTCYKEVIAGELVFEPSEKNIKIIKGNSYTFDFFYYTNAEEADITVANPNCLTTRLRTLENIPKIPNPDDPEGEYIDRVLPAGAVTMTADFATSDATELGTTLVTIRTYINDKRDIVNEAVFTVSVLANDDLPDNIQLINLKTKPMKSGRKKDILIEFPDDSATLVLKEEIEENTLTESGESFNAIQTVKPDAKTNTEIYNNKLNRTYLYLDNDKDKGPEIYASISDTTNDSIWKGVFSKEYGGEHITYPNPGEKGFGVGPAPTSLSDYIGLKPYDGCWDPNSDNYGNYYDYLGNTYVFIPKHYIIPKADPDKAGKFPYFGMTYQFSWVETAEFPESTIPRCFINAGKVQPGIFVAKYNGGITTQTSKKTTRYNEIDGCLYTSPREASISRPSIYRTTGYTESSGPEADKIYEESVAFPEIEEMALTHKQDNTLVDSRGAVIPHLKHLHNMTIFIQTMLVNLGDCHTIASYEKGSSDSVCGKLKEYVAGTLTKRLTNTVAADESAEVQGYAKLDSLAIGENHTLIRDIYRGSNAGDIDQKYKPLFSHNGQMCGAFDVNGGINVPLPGILVKQYSATPNTYEIYTLKEDIDIASLDKLTAEATEGINSDNIIFNSSLFNINNYNRIIDVVDNDSIKGMRYINLNKPYLTHDGENSLLITGDELDKASINAGINFNSLRNAGEGNYTHSYDTTNDYKACVDKHKNSVVYISALVDSSNISHARRDELLSMFVCNYIETLAERKDGGFALGGIFTGYRTRVLRLIGRLKYDKLNASKYLFSRRQCITPNL